MSRHAVYRLLFLAALSGALALASPGFAEEDEDEEDPWQHLTEREDKRRPSEPFSIDVAERPLTLGGEYEIELGYLRHRVVGRDVDQPDRLALEQGLELEAFYSFGEPLSLFAQVIVAMEEDLLPNTFESVSDVYVERGEMWLYSENIAGSHVNLDLGRLDFEDERRWWWDDELDAVRIAYETESFEVTLAAARELMTDRSDLDYVDPEHDRVFRLIGEAGWDWRRGHLLEFFLLYANDHSPTEEIGQVINEEREDDEDGELMWLGARALGIFDLASRGRIGYWLDAGGVFGEQHIVDFEDVSRRQSVAAEVVLRDVAGWGLDAGLSWFLPLRWEPRVFAGYAFGSGDASPEAGDDHAYQQTGLESNEAGFGGVERFAAYGLVLDPELSNLGIVTVGAGLSLLRSSSLDLVYHHYRLVEPAEFLRDTRLEAELDGVHRSLGHGIDLVLALEEWERLEFAFGAAAFRAGAAFGDAEGTWSYGGFAIARYAF